MSIFEPETWRAYTREETLEYISGLGKDKPEEAGGNNKRDPEVPIKAALILQSTISPLDLYAYLKSRFGEPNGFQTFLAGDHSDNMFHWDYYLDVDGDRVTFAGATQEVHVWLPHDIEDADWHRFILNLKSDFRRVGRDKSLMIRSFEKWHIFPNRFLAIGGRCAELYHKLQGSLPRLRADIDERGVRSNNPNFLAKSRTRSALLANITEACIELPILTPVLFETFIGLLVAFLTKPEVKANRRMFDAFQRSPLDVKIFDLANRCQGFERPIEAGNEVMARYWTVVNRRNDIIHGNLDPVKDASEIVYFDRKRPLYTSGGDRVVQFWSGIIHQYNPEQVLEDYLVAHEFIAEILNHMNEQTRISLMTIMEDTQPGWDDKRGKLGKLFDERIVAFSMPGLRYDTDLEPLPREAQV
jgi:hypothetical protein